MHIILLYYLLRLGCIVYSAILLGRFPIKCLRRQPHCLLPINLIVFSVGGYSYPSLCRSPIWWLSLSQITYIIIYATYCFYHALFFYFNLAAPMGFEPTIFAVTERYVNHYTTRPFISGFIVACRLVEPHLISNDVKFFCCLPTPEPLNLSISIDILFHVNSRYLACGAIPNPL